MGGYSAFQNFRAVLPHSGPVTLTPERLSAFNIGSNPVARGSLSLIYALFRRGDAAPSTHNVALQVSPELTKFSSLFLPNRPSLL